MFGRRHPVPLLRSLLRNSVVRFFTEIEEHCVPEDGHAVARVKQTARGGPAPEGSLGKVIDCVTFSRLLGFWTFCSTHH